MDVVTISPKFQVVIPRDIRERLGLEPGQKVLAYENRIEFIPSAADAEVLRARRAEFERDGDLGEPWRRTIQELKTRGV